MSAMLAEYFLSLYPGSNIVYDIRNSRSVPNVIKAAGGTPVVSRVGHAPIKQMTREVNAPFGGEASGHFFFRDNWFADSGIIGAVIGLYIAGLSGKKLSELREKYTHFAAIPEINFVVEDKQGSMDRIVKEYSNYDVNLMDGVTITIDDNSWFNVRPSNTESLLRLNAEAADQDALDELVANVTKLIKG